MTFFLIFKTCRKMNFITHKLPLVLIFIFVNGTFCPVYPLSIIGHQNENPKLKDSSRPRFSYFDAAATLPVSKGKELQDTLTLYKDGDGPENVWRTDKGDTVRIIPLAKSELERLETPQFHEPSFLRGEEPHKCKAKDARHHIPSHVSDESSELEEAAKREAELKEKLKNRVSKNLPLVKVSRNAYQTMNENGRTFFGLFGPSRPPPPMYGPPGPYYDPYFDGPPPPPYYGPDPYYSDSYYPW